jgi:leucyl aminopeptidase
MIVVATHKTLSEICEDVLIAPVFEDDSPRAGALAALDHLAKGAIAAVFESGEVSGKRDQWTLLHNAGELTVGKLLLYGAGKREASNAVSIQRVAGGAIRVLRSRGVRSVEFLVRQNGDPEVSIRATIEGAVMGQMSGGLYRAKDESAREIERLALVTEWPAEAGFERAIAVGTAMAEATNFARALGYEPGNVMTPTELANRAEAMAAREGLSVEVIGEDEMKRQGMGALLAVSRGSEEPARLITLDYLPEGDAATGGEVIALIGKGVTFDSGGISIKPAQDMDEMKYDMGGGAAVLGAMQVIARLKPATRVIGVVPATENLPSGRATKPGDVVRSLSGKTIEVINTDAEGRLILADAMTHVINRGATHLVDAATLTGACAVALGEIRAGVMGTDQRLIDDLIRSGEQSGELLWQLPLDGEYAELIRSDIADIKNVGNRTAGAISAAMFLKMFAGSLPWAHLDIAGTAWLEREKPYMARGATGFGARLLSSFVLNRAAARSTGNPD